jgi:hypothetical protein
MAKKSLPTSIESRLDSKKLEACARRMEDAMRKLIPKNSLIKDEICADLRESALAILKDHSHPAEEVSEQVPAKPVDTHDHKFFSLNGRYVVASETSVEDMLNDIACLLDSAKTILQVVIDGMRDENSEMATNASRDVPSLMYSALHQLEMVGNLAEACFYRR